MIGRVPRAVAGAVFAASWLVGGIACGGGSSFPEVEPCETPTGTPVSNRPGGGASNRYYREITGQGLRRLEELTSVIRVRWPNDEPSNRTEFRQQFATYARDTICLGTDLKALEPRGDQLGAYDQAYDAAMDEVIRLAEFGRDAVRSRNSSKYRDWMLQVDALPATYGELRASLPPPQ